MLNLRPKAARDDEPDLTPLIDMVFILLIFFILAASFAVRGIDLDLPPAHSGQALSGRVVEIRLLRDGSFLCEGIPVARVPRQIVLGIWASGIWWDLGGSDGTGSCVKLVC